MADKKILQQADWYAKHVLTQEQFKQLIQNKLDRVKLYHRAVDKKREEPLGHR
jgi:hypothetical protein